MNLNFLRYSNFWFAPTNGVSRNGFTQIPFPTQTRQWCITMKESGLKEETRKEMVSLLSEKHSPSKRIIRDKEQKLIKRILSL